MRGYALWPDPQSRETRLVFNHDFHDGMKRINSYSGNELMGRYSRAVTGICSMSERNLPLSPLQPLSRYEQYFGFFLHESLHPIQFSRWTRPDILDSFNGGNSSAASEYFLFERISFFLVEALRKSLRGETISQEIGKARFLWERALRAEPAISRLDNLNEGTATFMEGRSKALLQVGCSASLDRLNQRHFEILERLVHQHNALGSSSYTFSALSGLILEIMLEPGWREKAEDGHSPFQILLNKFASVRPSHDEILAGETMARCKDRAITNFQSSSGAAN